MTDPRIEKALKLRRDGEDWAGALVAAHCGILLDKSYTTEKTDWLLRAAVKQAANAADAMCFSAIGFNAVGIKQHYGPIIPHEVENPVALIIACNEGQRLGAILAMDELCHHVDRLREEIASAGAQIPVPAIWATAAHATDGADKDLAFNCVAYRFAMSQHGEQVRKKLESGNSRGDGLIPAVVALIGIEEGASCGVIALSYLPAPLAADDVPA